MDKCAKTGGTGRTDGRDGTDGNLQYPDVLRYATASELNNEFEIIEGSKETVTEPSPGDYFPIPFVSGLL